MLRFALVAAVLAALLAPVGLAHKGAPLRTKAQAEQWIKKATIRLAGGKLLRKKRLVYCSGVPASGRGARFRHFNCLVVARTGKATCCLPVHTLPNGRWAYGKPRPY